MNRKIYKNAMDSIQFSENLNTRILNYLTTVSLKKQNNLKRKKAINIAAVSFIAVCILILINPLLNSKPDFDLRLSVGKVSVSYTEDVPADSRSNSLAYSYTEEELFHNFNTAIFKGTIIEIKNIKINIGGSNEYRAKAKIKIDKIYRGNNATVGKTVSVLLPSPISDNSRTEDSETISAMKVGTTGIFMPLIYNDNSYEEKNNARLYWKDIADCGFLDGSRFAFLDTENGLIFNHSAYETISSATSLDEIEKYVIDMINVSE